MGLLWRKLMGSAYRDVFIRWIYQKKDSGRVTLNHALFEEHRKYLLQTLWTKEEEMKGMTEGEVIIFI